MSIGNLIDRTLLATTLKRFEATPAKQGQAALSRALVATDENAIKVNALAELKRFNAGLSPTMRKLKYERMAVDASSFYRGSDHLAVQRLMARLGDKIKGFKPSVIQDDFHLGNLSTLPRTGRGALFGANDFDEAFVGPALVDVTHFATSIELVARQRGLSPADTRKLVEDFGAKYRSQLERLAKGKGESLKVPRVVSEAIDKADALGPTSAIDKLEKGVNGALSIKRDETTLSLSPTANRDVRAAFQRFQQSLPAEDAAAWKGYAVTDAVSAISGVGSVGRGRYRLLLTATDKRPARLIELKEEATSAAGPYMPGRWPSRDQADRALVAARIFNPDANVYLGKTKLPRRDALESTSFVVRDAGLTKVPVDLGTISHHDLHDLVKYAARQMADGHARGELAGFASAQEILASVNAQLPADLASYAHGEANQVVSDHADFVQALKAGKL